MVDPVTKLIWVKRLPPRGGPSLSRRVFLAAVAATCLQVNATFAQTRRVRVVGMLLSQSPDSQEALDRIEAVRDGLRQLGWIEGANLRIETRHASGRADRLKASADELVRLNPDVIVASASSALSVLQEATMRVPIVFAQVTDPVGAGFVRSLARPGGNITGFTQHDFSIGLKWMELLKELSPETRRISVIYDPQNPATQGYLVAMVAASPAFGVDVAGRPVRDENDIRQALAATADGGNGGLVVLPGPAPSVSVELVTSLARDLRIPAVYPFRYWVAGGGLAFYGIDNIELHRQTALYVDRILKGESPGELPIQNASRFELAINLRAAKALGINPPTSLLARADELVE